MKGNNDVVKTGIRIRFDTKGEAIEGYDKNGKQWPGSERGYDQPDGPVVNRLNLTVDRGTWRLKNDGDPEPWGCVPSTDSRYLEVALDEQLAAVEAKPDRGIRVRRREGCDSKLPSDSSTVAYELRQGTMAAAAVRCCWVKINGRWYCMPY